MHRPIFLMALLFILMAEMISMFGLQYAAAASAVQRSAVPTTGVSDVDDRTEYDFANVMLDGRTLFPVRGVAAYPAEERAKAITQRIVNIAADRSVTIESLRLVEQDDRTRIMAGDRLVVILINADAAEVGLSRQILAERVLVRVKEAIASYRADRSPRSLLISTLYALGATLALAVVLLAIRSAFRKLDALAGRHLHSRIEALEAQSHQIVEARQMRMALQGLLKSSYVLVLLVLGYGYFNFVLGLYPWTRSLANQLLEIFLQPLQAIGLGLVESLPGIAFVVVVAVVARYALKLIRLYFESIDRGTITLARFDREWALPTYKIVRLLMIVFAVVVAYPYIPGSSSEAFRGVSIFIGVVFSLGSSSVIANLMAGYSMIYRRAFKVGDRITIDNLTGDVTEIRLMVTHLRTIKNEEIVVPNSSIINSNIVNYNTLASSRGLILHTTVGIGYETPWRQVQAMLRVAADRTPGLLKEPAPFVLQKSLGDFAVTYELNAYCDNPQAMGPLYTAMHQNVLDVFNEHGVQIMTPAYESDTEQPKVVPKERWYLEPAEANEPPINDEDKR